MRIAQINNTNQNFNGYLDKSVYRYVNMATLNNKANLYRISAKIPECQVKAAMAQFDRLRQITIDNLEKFISGCHADTYLKIEKKNGSFPKLILNNKKLKLEESIPGVDLLDTLSDADRVLPIRSNLPDTYKGDYITSLTITDLTQIKSYSEQLVKLDPRETDLKVLNKYKLQCLNKTKELQDSKNNKLIEKYAKDIGLE